YRLIIEFHDENKHQAPFAARASVPKRLSASMVRSLGGSRSLRTKHFSFVLSSNEAPLEATDTPRL
ncbi:MAG: hypothetical protein ACO20O_11645, partial [Pseudomonadales bacterium]